MFAIFFQLTSSTEDVCQNRKCVRTRDDLNKKCSEVRRYP